ncbi:MAG: hypothetical protein ACTHW2_09840 [Tissierella sp.]|uniref:hypothetical protein n=1 Tax=Tissierella sp. TaxID=41274 RepID=UPI003F945626
MDSIKKITNSNILDDIFDIPENLKNKKVVITISAYEGIEDISKMKSLRGALSKYKNGNLREEEDNAWAMAVQDKHENS